MHRFSRGGETWAVILGTWDDPEKYALWGVYKDYSPNVTGYLECSRLERCDSVEVKVPSTVRAVRSRRKRKTLLSLDDDDDEDEAYQPGHKRTRAHASKTLDVAPQERSDGRTIGIHAPNEMSARGKHPTDDEEDTPISDLRRLRQNNPAAAQANVDQRSNNPVAPGTQPFQQKIVGTQASLEAPNPTFDFDAAYKAACTHLCNAKSQGSDRPVIMTQAVIDRLKNLENSMKKEFVFRIFWGQINDVLGEIGVPGLPRL